MKKIISILLFSLIAGHGLNAAGLAQRGDSAYNAENYRLAIDLYIQSLAADGASTDVYYNLGNAYYRNDNVGKAVVNYERALRADPTNADARFNLDFVRSHIQDRPEDDSAFLTNLHKSIVTSMKANTWAVVSIVIFILFLGAAALYIFSPSMRLRKAGFFSGIILLIAAAYTIYVAYSAREHACNHDSAVVIVPMTQLSSVPRPSRAAEDRVVPIHEGTVVQIIDSVATPDDPVSPMWYNVKINNSTKAWLRACDVERI